MIFILDIEDKHFMIDGIQVGMASITTQYIKLVLNVAGMKYRMPLVQDDINL